MNEIAVRRGSQMGWGRCGLAAPLFHFQKVPAWFARRVFLSETKRREDEED